MTTSDSKSWFKNEAKFGMMVHFGLYSMIGGEWNGKCMDYIGEWAQSYFRIPNKEYHALASAFNPMLFSADEWISLAKEAGMNYFVITAKHHDGFALFKSKVSDFNVVDATPFGRDIIAELSAACQKHGVKMGIYYSQAIDWSHPDGCGFKRDELNFGMNWGNNWDFTESDRTSYEKMYEEKIKPQVCELLTNYGDMCLIWFDTPVDIEEKYSKDLYDTVKRLQPQCLINSRLGNGLGDYRSAEDNYIPQSNEQDILYETPATLNDTWGFKPTDQNWKSPEKVLAIKKHLNSNGINYLLNVGPDALGRIPSRTVDILKKLNK